MRGAGLGFVAGFLLAWLLDLHHVQRGRRVDYGVWRAATQASRYEATTAKRLAAALRANGWRDLENVDAV